MADALALSSFTPTPIGIDYFYLVDGTDTYPRVLTVREIAEILEADSYYDEPGRIAGAPMYLLIHGRAPMSVRVEYSIYARDTQYCYKIIRIYNQTGDLLSQHGYQISAN